MRTLKLLTLSFAILGLASTSLAQSPLTEYISGTTSDALTFASEFVTN